MKRHMEYLTDAELDSFIRDIEQQELVVAPPELKNQILERIEQKECLQPVEQETKVLKVKQERSMQEKLIEYKRFRFRVWTTVAAAVLAILLLPKLEIPQQQEIKWLQTGVKQELPEQKRCVTREEVLSDSGIFETLLGGEKIFSDGNRWNLFRK